MVHRHLVSAEAGTVVTPDGSEQSSPAFYRTLLLLSTPRYCAVMLAPFVVAYLASGASGWSYPLFGAPALILGELAGNFANQSADRASDAIDYPERTRLCLRVGYRTLDWLAALCAAIYLALVILMVTVSHTALRIAAVWVAMLLLGLAYSWGPRLKGATMTGAVTMAAVPAAAVWVGWRYRGAIGDIVPTFMVVLAMRLSIVGAKDAPNVEGDEAAGVPTFYQRLTRGGALLPMAVALVPFADIVFLVSIGWLSTRYVVVLAALPFAIVYGLLVARAHSLEERQMLREASNFYQFIFFVALLWALYPHPIGLVFSLSSFVWYALSTWYLHPERGLLTYRTWTVFLAVVRPRGDRRGVGA